MIRLASLYLGMYAMHVGAQVPTAEQHAQKGSVLARSGDMERAEAEVRQAVSLAPNNAEYLSTLGSILGMRKNMEESSLCFEKALRLNPHDWATRRNLASNQFQAGKLEPARKNLEIVLRANAEDKTAVLLLGMVAEELRDYPTAIRRLASVPDLVRERPQSIAALARAYYRTGAKENARAALASIDRVQMGSEGIFLSAQIAAAEADYETAARLLASIRSEYADRDRLDYELALVDYHASRIDESIEILRSLAGRGRQTSDVFNLTAWCLYKKGNFKGAVAAMDLAIEREPARESNYFDLGMILLSYRRFDVALEVATKAVVVAPESYQAHMLKGLVEARMSHLNDAEKTYAHAVELNQKASEALLALALVESANEKQRQSRQTFERALKKFPRNGVIYQEYARMLLKFSAGADPAAKAKAISLLESALGFDGSLAESHYQLGNLALNDGDLPLAIKHLETALRLRPASSKIHFALARAYKRAGRSEQASKKVASFQRLKSEEEKSPDGAITKGATPEIPDLSSPEPDADPNHEPR
jgi:tetratricopeptide (TPR) repeat protein